MSVRYKFKNARDKDYTTLEIDGFDISVIDLKKAIVHNKKMGNSTEFDIIITDEAKGKEYEKDDDLVPKNSSLTVARRPLPPGQKKVWKEDKAVLNSLTTDHKKMDMFKPSMESSDLTEDEQISKMMSDSSDMYSQKNWQILRGRSAYHGQKVPNTYVCNKCHKPGHFIHDCPTLKQGNATELKRTTGIPRSFLEPVDPNKISDTPGAKINPQGIIMVNKREQAATHTKPKNDRPDWESETAPLTKDAIEKTLQIPEHLKCPVCHDLIKDAVMLPSCADEMCDECARDSLINPENTKNECPVCAEPDNSPEELIPVRKTREEARKFRSSHMKDNEHNNLSALNKKLKEEEEQKRPTLAEFVDPRFPKEDTKSPFDHLLTKSGSKSPLDINHDSLTPKYTPKDTPKDDETKIESAKSTPRPTSTSPTRTPTSPNKVSAPTTPKSPKEEKDSQPPQDVTQPPPGFNPIPVPVPVSAVASILPGTYVIPTAGIPAGIMPTYVEDPLTKFNQFLSQKDQKDRYYRSHRDRPRYGDRYRRSRSRSPPPYRRYPRSPPNAYRRSKYSPPARYRDHSPPRVERRAPPPLSPHHKGPRTPPSPGRLSPGRSKSPRRSKSRQPSEPTTPPPGVETPHSPLGGVEKEPSTPLNDEKPEQSTREKSRTPVRSPVSDVQSNKDRTPSLSPEPVERRKKQHPGDYHRQSASREYEDPRFYAGGRDHRYKDQDRGGDRRKYLPRSRSRERMNKRSRSPLPRSPTYRHDRPRSRSPPYARHSRSPYRQRSPPGRTSKYRDHRSRSPSPPLREHERGYQSKTRYSDLDEWKAKEDYERENRRDHSPRESRDPKVEKKEKKKKDKKKKRRRSDSNSESDAEPKKKSKKVKKSKKIKSEDAQQSPERQKSPKEIGNSKTEVSKKQVNEKLPTNESSEVPSKVTTLIETDAKTDSTPELSKEIKKEIKKSKPIEIKINTTELSKTIEPEQHKDPTPENPSKNKKDEDNVEDEMNDTLEINLLPEKSKWEMSDEEDHNEKLSSRPQSNPPIKTKDEPIDVDKDINSPPPKVQDDKKKLTKKIKKRQNSTESDEETISKKSSRKKAPKTESSEDSADDEPKKSKRKSKDKKHKDKKDRKSEKSERKEKKLAKMLKLMKDVKEDPDLMKQAMALMAAGESGTSSKKSKRSRSRSRSRSSTPKKNRRSPARNVIADGSSLKVNLGRSNSPRDPSRSRRIAIPESRPDFRSNRKSRSRSRSPSREVTKKSKSIKDRLGAPLGDRLGPVDQGKSFKQDHWNGKSKQGKIERNGSGNGRGSKRELSNRDKESAKRFRDHEIGDRKRNKRS